jgi:hypothetical protein
MNLLNTLNKQYINRLELKFDYPSSYLNGTFISQNTRKTLMQLMMVFCRFEYPYNDEPGFLYNQRIQKCKASIASFFPEEIINLDFPSKVIQLNITRILQVMKGQIINMTA